MYSNIKVLSSEDKRLKVSQIKSFRYALDTTQVIITLDEFFKAAKSQPILFGKDASGTYYAASLLGLKSDRNLFINGKGEWKQDEYIPAYIRRYPFIFVQEKESLALGVDLDCKEVNVKKGNALFDDESQPTEYLNSVLEFMQSYQKSTQKTSATVLELNKLGLLEEASATLLINEEPLVIKGFFKVNEEKLDALNEETTLALVKSGVYKYIIAHLLSLSNFEKLVAYSK